MFFEIMNFNGDLEFVNANHITKVFEHKQVTRINLSDGTYVITKISPDEVMELIHES